MITEMVCSPTPQWVKDFQKEIIEKFDISRTDAIIISGKVCKIVREQKAIDDEEFGEALLYCTNKTAERVKREMIEKGCDYLYEWNKQQAIKYDARDILSATEYTIDVNDFRKHLEE